MKHTIRQVSLALLCALLASACEREVRPFQELSVASARSQKPSLSALYPGSQPPATPENSPFQQNAYGMSEGKRLFDSFNCSGCHGGRAGGGMGPSLRDVDWLYGNSDAQLFSTIVEGRAHGMPSWQTRLTADQVWKLVSYIKALRTRNEPQAPPTG